MILDFSWNFLHMCTRLDVIYASHYYLKVWTSICLKLHLEFRSSNDWNSFVRYCMQMHPTIAPKTNGKTLSVKPVPGGNKHFSRIMNEDVTET